MVSFDVILLNAVFALWQERYYQCREPFQMERTESEMKWQRIVGYTLS